MSDIIRTILTYGDVIRRSDDASHSHADMIHNGSIASVHLFVAMFAVGFCIVLAPYITGLSIKKFENTFTKLILFAFMSVGLVVMSYFFKVRHRLLVRRDRPLGSRKRLTLSGILVFYIFGCVLDMSYLMRNFSCSSVLAKCGDYMLIKLVVSIIYHLTRIVYFGIETVLCLVVSGARFRDEVLVRYGLMILQAVNITNWFQIILHESTPLHNYVQPTKTSYSKYCDRSLHRNWTEDDMTCLNKTTTLHDALTDHISPIFFPFPYEFSILFGECIFAWFSNCTYSPALTDTTSEHGTEQLTGDHGNPTQILQPSNVNISQEDISQETSSLDESTSLLSWNNRPHRLPLTIRHYFFQFIGGLLNIMFLLISFLPYISHKSVEFQQTRRYFTIFFSATIILLLFFGYLCLFSNFQPLQSTRKFRNLDYCLMISSVGPYIYGIIWFMIIAIGFQKTGVKSAATDLTLILITTLSVALQIPFTYQAGRIAIPETVFEQSPKGRSLKSKLLMLKVITLHLAISNGTWWIIETFAVPHSDILSPATTKHMKEGALMMLHNFVHPLVLFFRFNSCILFTCAFMRLMKEKTGTGRNGNEELRDTNSESTIN